jgi:hypothetical protein
VNISPGLHPDFRGVVEAVVGSLDAVYPVARVAGVDLFERDGDRSLAHVAGRTIVLNAHWFARPRAVLDEEAKVGREAARYGMPLWHGGMGEPEHLLTHEFGHVLAAALPASGKLSGRGHAAALVDPAVAVSGYALVDPDEWWGETFAALRLGHAASPQVAEMEAFLAQHT